MSAGDCGRTSSSYMADGERHVGGLLRQQAPRHLRLLLACALGVTLGAVLAVRCGAAAKGAARRAGRAASPGPIDYADIVRVESTGMPDGNGVLYYSRRTGQRSDGLLAVPSAVGIVDAMWHCPARSRDGDGKAGIIDRCGNWVVPPIFDAISHFRSGRAVASVGGKVGVVDNSGRWVVRPGVYEQILSFEGGMAPCQRDGVWGFLRLDGSVQISPKYAEARSFADGLAVVRDGDKWYCIDRRGDVRFEMSDEPPGRKFVWGRLLVSEETMGKKMAHFGAAPKYGYVSSDGNVAVPLRYDYAEEFSEGLAVVGMDSNDPRDILANQYGAIDMHGKNVVPAKYARLRAFRDGLAAFREGGRWGYLDRGGGIAIPARFEKALSFADGVAVVSVEGKVCVIDMAGRVLIKTGLEWVEF